MFHADAMQASQGKNALKAEGAAWQLGSSAAQGVFCAAGPHPGLPSEREGGKPAALGSAQRQKLLRSAGRSGATGTICALVVGIGDGMF